MGQWHLTDLCDPLALLLPFGLLYLRFRTLPFLLEVQMIQVCQYLADLERLAVLLVLEDLFVPFAQENLKRHSGLVFLVLLLQVPPYDPWGLVCP